MEVLQLVVNFWSKFPDLISQILRCSEQPMARVLDRKKGDVIHTVQAQRKRETYLPSGGNARATATPRPPSPVGGTKSYELLVHKVTFGPQPNYTVQFQWPFLY